MTLRGVAEKAGVAVDTARKVVRGDPSVRPYIRRQVESVIRETGYRPNLVARALREKHLDLVPLSVMRLDLPYFGRLATRMSELVVKCGAEPALCLDAKHLISLSRSYSPRGCISMSHIERAQIDALARTQRVVVVNQDVPVSDNVSVVAIDFEGAYRALTEKILSIGKERVAVISPYYLEAGRRGWPRQKFPAVIDALAARGLATVGPEPGHVFSSAAEFAAWVLAAPRGAADAVLCENDHVGAAVVGELAEAGLSTPRDMLIVGCDADIAVPGMWSVRPDTDAIAASAVEMLRAMIVDGAKGSFETIHPVPVDETGAPIPAA